MATVAALQRMSASALADRLRKESPATSKLAIIDVRDDGVFPFPTLFAWGKLPRFLF